MADSKNQQPGTANLLTGGMWKDNIDMLKKEHSYGHARNATVWIPDGQRGALHSEPSNVECITFPYPPIGYVHLVDDQWVVFMTDNVNSEIGLIYENQCKYETLTKGKQNCLNFHQDSLITGVARRGFDCGFNVYWSDGARNPDRFLNTAKVPWVQNCTTPPGSPCVVCVDTNVLDCDKLRIAPLFDIPCLTLSKSQGSGTLPSGSYQVAIAYTINEIRCTDYCAVSNIQAIFDHTGIAGAVTLTISGAETNTFDQMEVVIIAASDQQVQAKRLGTYSTRQQVIYIDDIGQTLPPVDISLIPISNPAISASDAIYSINNYLTRVGPRTEADFNYQPLANQIIVKWACIEYEGDYYHKGGSSELLPGGIVITYPMNVGYQRGEVYAFSIQWVYSTGEYTAEYHIPGLPAGTAPTITAVGTPAVPGSVRTIASGRMEGYSSTEKYPDNQPLVWGALCGMPIMHHKFPDQTSFGGTTLSHFSPSFPTPTGVSNNIRVMALFLENIQPPRDNNGNIIPNIVGYRVLRASREGHKSVLATGMVNHMRTFTDASGAQGLFQNYPFNDLRPDPFLTSNVNNINNGTKGEGFRDPLTGYRSDVISFHSPDTVFQHPYLGPGQLKVVMGLTGRTQGQFKVPWEHPKMRVLTNLEAGLAIGIGILAAITNVINAIAGYPIDIELASTDDLPMVSHLGSDPSGIVAGTTVAIANPAVYASNIAIAIVFAPIQARIIGQQILNVIKGIIPPRQFALQYNSAGFYSEPDPYTGSTHSVSDYQYIEGIVQIFAGLNINNLYRNRYVALQLTDPNTGIPQPIPDALPLAVDRSRVRITDAGVPVDNEFQTTIGTYYASYRVPQPSQYGQIGSTKDVPISCTTQVDVFSAAAFSTDVLFGGDTYICRYTEKNPFFFFNDWLVKAPLDIEYDYRNYINVPYPMYWIDNTNMYYDFWLTASDNRRLNGPVNGNPFYVKTGYFYLFNNGVRDFYCESEVNVGYRDWEEDISKRFYDPYGFTDTNIMFRSDIIKSDILYKYDYSLSAGRLYNQYISWAQYLRRDYDPTLAYTCFNYYPRRIQYSLPQQEEQKRDNWRMFLPNNYLNTPSKPTCILPMARTGAMVLFEDRSPAMLPGVDSIPTQSGVEYSVGTGQLFNQPLQFMSNAETGMQYGSCQSRLSVINTPLGIFWVSRDSGKVFHHTGEGMKDISSDGMKWWLSRYLPSQLLQQFPNYPLHDNPVAGIGIQATYDSVSEILYICKKDYKLKNQYTLLIPGSGTVPSLTSIEIRNGHFYLVTQTPTNEIVVPITTGDPQYFEDASWTLSYDIRNKQFISLHDWWPDLHMSSNNHFLTSKGSVLYRHNSVTNSFCRFYGTQYPFEVEVPVNTQVMETTLQSVEVLLDAYRYRQNQVDTFQQYDGFFTHAMVYNPEQNSQMMGLTLKPWNNPYLANTYPLFPSSGPNILYDRVEGQHRFNWFYDYTDDRGMFTLATNPMFFTDETGYRFTLNTAYFDTLKPQMQLKRMRYTGSKLFMRKANMGVDRVSLRYIATRNQISRR